MGRNFVADIETIQSQLAKPIPKRGIIPVAWTAIKGTALIAECMPMVEPVQHYIGPQ